MFGAHAGKRDRRFIGAWFERLGGDRAAPGARLGISV